MSAPGADFWAEVPLGRGVLPVAMDENGVGALAKPAGVLSHPNEGLDEARSLLQARYVLEEECYEWPAGEGGEPQRLWLLNRLDSATSGVILVCANGELAAEIREQFRRKQVRKVYLALVFGGPRQPMELWRDLLVVEKRGGKIRTTAAAGHVVAECRMSVVRGGHGAVRLTLIRLEPRTGRSHQLRVQCAKRGLPIVGDQTYGDFRRNRDFARFAGTKRMFLHSLETACEYELRGRRFAFTAKAALPAEFEHWL